jgi:hypothetical protein
MLNPEDLFVMDLDSLREDLYRMGNSTSPNFSEARGLIDCLVVDLDGIKMVVANGNGFSAFNRITQVMKSRGKNVWKIKKGSPLPEGIKLVKDLTNAGHFMLAPTTNMPFKKFLGLLEEIATDSQVSVKLTPEEIVGDAD